jgi:hypothetical protein
VVTTRSVRGKKGRVNRQASRVNVEEFATQIKNKYDLDGREVPDPAKLAAARSEFARAAIRSLSPRARRLLDQATGLLVYTYVKGNAHSGDPHALMQAARHLGLGPGRLAEALAVLEVGGSLRRLPDHPAPPGYHALELVLTPEEAERLEAIWARLGGQP